MLIEKINEYGNTVWRFRLVKQMRDGRWQSRETRLTTAYLNCYARTNQYTVYRKIDGLFRGYPRDFTSFLKAKAFAINCVRLGR